MKAFIEWLKQWSVYTALVLTVLAIIASKDPAGYREFLYPWIMWAGVVFLVVAGAHNFAIWRALRTLKKTRAKAVAELDNLLEGVDSNATERIASIEASKRGYETFKYRFTPEIKALYVHLHWWMLTAAALLLNELAAELPKVLNLGGL